MTAMKHSAVLLVALAASLSAGCSTQKIHTENRALLTASLESLRGEKPQQAETQAVEVLARTGEVADDYALQRFFANYLATRANMDAFFEGPYLTEPVTGAWAGLGEEGSRRPSKVGHLVATAYHGTYALDAYPGVRGASTVVKGAKLLPPELEALGADGAYLHVKLCLLTVYSRLQYQDQVNQVLRAIDGATELAEMDAMLERTGASPGMRPWIYRAVFENLKKSNEKTAYKYAIRTLDTAEDPAAAFDDEARAEIEHWITTDSSYVFRCPECPDAPVNVAYPLCTKCRNVDRIDFQAELRPSGGSKETGAGS